MSRRTRDSFRAGAAAAAAPLVIAFGLLAAGCHGGPTLRIGAALPLSGADAAVGQGMKNAMQLAVNEANARAGWRDPRFELLVLDERSSPDGSLEAGKQLAADDRVIAACAHYDEVGAINNNHLFHDAALANLVPGAIDADITEHLRRMPEWYRIIPGNRPEMRAAATYAYDVVKARRFATVQDDTHPSRRYVYYFREGLRRRGATDDGSQTEVPRTQRDFKDLVAQIKGVDIEYVLFAGSPEQGLALFEQLRAAGSNATLQLASKYPSTELLAKLGERAGRVIATAQVPLPEDTAGGRAFLAAYQGAGFHEPAGPYAIPAYASMQALLRAVLNSNHTRASVIGALKRGKFETALGPVRFDEWGQQLDSWIPVYRAEGGKWVPIHRIKEAEVKAWSEP